MGQVHSIDEHVVAQLRARLGAAEEDREDLIAFARGHRGAVASVHHAVLEAMGANDINQLAQIVVGKWPQILGIDHCALALVAGRGASLVTDKGRSPLDSAILRRALAGLPPVVVRDVERGHPLFGPGCASIRAEALVRLDSGSSRPCGLLLLGQDCSPGLDEFGGSELLRFLGQSLAAMIGRWRTQATS
jgi:uncharacterized protein YigA (DUF484 family)